MVCVSHLEVWDLNGRIDVPLPFGLPDIKTPAWKLFSFELAVTYYNYGGNLYTHDIQADNIYLSTGWHIDQSSLNYGAKEGGGAMATARFGAGGFNPWGFWPWGFNTDVQLIQRIKGDQVIGTEEAQQNPFTFPLIKTRSSMECSSWQ